MSLKPSGGGSKNQTTTTTSEPPKYLQPYLQQGVAGASNLYSQGPAQYYPGQTVVGFSPETEQSLGMMTNRATTGSPVMGQANNFAQQTLAGGAPNNFGGGSNPYSASVYRAPGNNPYAANSYKEGPNNFGAASNPLLDSMFNKAADTTQIRLASEFAGRGRNLAAARPARAEELENLATSIYGGAYENERGRELQAGQAAADRGLSAYLQGQNIGATSFEADQGRRQQANLAGQSIGATGYESERDRFASELGRNQSAQLGVLGMAPQLAASDYADIDRLGQVGQMREDLTGRQYEDAASRWDFGQNAQGTALDQYLARLNGYPGAVSSSSTPIYRNQGAGALGGALAGYNIGNQFGGNGGMWGTILGGLLGYGG